MVDKPLANRLREMILMGELEPGERLTEMGLSNLLGVSRTPIRGLLPSLAAEGLLTPVGRRGFAVAQFSETESQEALEVRALLEGQAARKLAERGPSPELLGKLQTCLSDGDMLLFKGYLDPSDRDSYGEMNERFHTLIVEAAGSPLVSAMINRLNHIPFVGPSVPVFDRAHAEAMFALMFRAHGHHHAIVEALGDRNGARAEAVFREHANIQMKSMFSHEAIASPASSRTTSARKTTRHASGGLGRRPLTTLA